MVAFMRPTGQVNVTNHGRLGIIILLVSHDWQIQCIDCAVCVGGRHVTLGVTSSQHGSHVDSRVSERCSSFATTCHWNLKQHCFAPLSATLSVLGILTASVGHCLRSLDGGSSFNYVIAV